MNKKFIHVRQKENYDCGAACVSTMLKTYGLNISNKQINKSLKMNQYGTSMLSISRFLNQNGLSNKVYNVGDKLSEFIHELPLPCIAVIDNENMNHYIVIHDCRGSNLFVSDPLDFKLRNVSISDFKQTFSGILLLIEEVTPSDDNKSKMKKDPIYKKHLISFFKDNKKFLIYTFILSIFVTAFGVTSSFFTGILVDVVIPGSLSETLNFFALIFIGFAILQCSFQYLRDRLIIKTARKIEKNLTKKYFRHLLKLKQPSFRNREVGQYISRFNDALTLTEMFSRTLITSIVDLLLIFISGVLLFNVSSTLFLLALMPILLYVGISYLFFDKLALKNRKAMEKHADVNSFFIQTLSGIDNIKALNKEKNIEEINKQKLQNYIDDGLKLDRTNVLNMYFKNIVQLLFPILILWIGGKQILASNLTLGALFTFLSLMNYFFTSIQNIVNLQPYIQKSIIAAERFFNIIEHDKTEENQHSGVLGNQIESISLRDLDYSYKSGTTVLKNVNISLEKGESAVFVGRSGLGKSTLGKILIKFLEVENGKVFINNQDINTIDTNSIRSRVTYLNDKSFFVKGTILENLCLGSQYSRSEIESACEIACIKDFIEALPGDYEFKLRENANNISLGQAQRLSLARAILNKPDVLILDEVLSNIDEENAKQIMLNLKKLDLIKVFINHNVYLNEYYDKIYTFTDKSIILSERKIEAL